MAGQLHVKCQTHDIMISVINLCNGCDSYGGQIISYKAKKPQNREWWHGSWSGSWSGWSIWILKEWRLWRVWNESMAEYCDSVTAWPETSEQSRSEIWYMTDLQFWQWRRKVGNFFKTLAEITWNVPWTIFFCTVKWIMYNIVLK